MLKNYMYSVRANLIVNIGILIIIGVTKSEILIILWLLSTFWLMYSIFSKLKNFFKKKSNLDFTDHANSKDPSFNSSPTKITNQITPLSTKSSVLNTNSKINNARQNSETFQENEALDNQEYMSEIFESSIYERITFSIKDDEDFTWTSKRTTTLEMLCNEDQELVAYSVNEKWIKTDDIDEIIDAFLELNTTTEFLSENNIDISMARAMIICCLHDDLSDLNDNFSGSFKTIDSSERMTEDYSGCFFIEKVSAESDFKFSPDGKLVSTLMDDGDDDTYGFFQDKFFENLYIIIRE